MNVSELAIAFASLGAVEAVNLDGGGSTAAWMAGEGVVDRPTCDDNIQNGANHVHAVWRDFKNDFGRDLLKWHYQNVAH